MKRKNWLVLLAALAFALALGACDKGADGEATETAEEASKPAPKPLTSLFTSKQVVPPGPLAKVKVGMTAAQARQAAPELFEKSYGLVSDEFEGVTFHANVNEETGKVNRLDVKLPKAKARKLITDAWGPGKDAKDTIDRPEVYWFNAQAGLRAILKEGYGEEMSLEFTLYMPAEKMLGQGKDRLGWESRPLLGANLEQIQETYKDWLVVTSQKEAAEQRKKTEKLVGKKLDKTLGQARPSAHLDLPPTEFGSYWTRVNMSFDKAGKVEYFWMGIDYGPHPAAKEEIMALIKAKYGDPKKFKDLGREALLFLKKPRVVVTDDTISKKWDLKVE